jgi:phosphotransferase system HPr (HPr) family protein
MRLMASNSMNEIRRGGSYGEVKRLRVVVPWNEGLHFRPAAKLVQIAQKFRSSVLLKCGQKVADLRSILSMIALCATMGTALEVEAAGDDEEDAIQAVQRVFSSVNGNDSFDGAPKQRS